MNVHPADRRLISRAAPVLLALAVLAILLVGAPTASVQADGPDKVPAAPNKLAGTHIFIGGVDLEWNDASGAESYEVQLFQNSQWMDLPGGGVEIAYYGAGAIITKLNHSGSSYYFQVRANNAKGSSEWSLPHYMTPTDQSESGRKEKPYNVAATGAPTISGTAEVGETLTASVADIGDANGLDRVEFSYQWTSNDGNADADIAGATDSSYTLVPTDEGTTIKVKVSFTDRGGYQESLTSGPAGLPAIRGTAQVGETLTSDTSSIGDGRPGTVFTYQWLANGVEIEGATSNTYTLVEADEGKRISVGVSFTDGTDSRETVTSEPTAAVGPRLNRPATGLPTISGTIQVGETLTANTNDIDDQDGMNDAVFTYQWLANDVDIAGATNDTYTLRDADEGKRIKVKVSFTDDRNHQETLTSEATVAVAAARAPLPDVQESCSEDYDPDPTPVAVEAVPIVVESTTDEYFVLYVLHDLDDTEVALPVSVTLGQDGTTTLSENVEALPAERYRVEKYLIADPADVDGDCIDDITELDDLGNMNPVNPAAAIDASDGSVIMPDHATFQSFSQVIPKSTFKNRPFVKFVLFWLGTDRPGIYFQNTNTHPRHGGFLRDVLVLNGPSPGMINGQVAYDPELVAPDGSLGVYYFWSDVGAYSFSQIAQVYAVLAANMPLLEDNLVYFIRTDLLPQQLDDLPLYRESRIGIVFSDDIHPGVDFLALNPQEGYGLLRALEPDDRPHPRDIVIYETLPNELPPVAGIITTVYQTPLSHVNLRAVQNGVPNAYIRDVHENTDITELLGSYVRYVVTESDYSIESATLEEVNAYYAASRPAAEQVPQRDLSVTEITALSEIGFEDWAAFGVKAANVAVLGTLGFPEGTVPDGFAVPFYFYDEFMKHNGFYDDIKEMLADEDFQTDFEVQDDELKDLRKAIKKGETPDWIIEALTEMHATYPDGQSLRYRSSTNNEDLPGFNGAGLYDSKTQHPEETEEDGIAKSLKQVYASLWNFRAFSEREFHRIDHLAAAMGVLVHPNYSDELANGVAVSFDPTTGSDENYYVNTQIGEDLVTNPDAHSVPEEIRLRKAGSFTDNYHVLATSNQVPQGQLIMSDFHLNWLRLRLTSIHEKFADLYNIGPEEQFAIEVEFKITSDNILAIKQARPWVFSVPNSPATGHPTISGTVRVGEILTAHTSGINDADGLNNVEYNFNWGAGDYIRVMGIDNTYRVQARDVGLTIRVWVGFTDDAGNLEIQISADTVAVSPTTPAAPQNLNVSHHSTGALDLSWEAPSADWIGEVDGKGTHGDGGSPITGHKVQWKEADDDWGTPADVTEETVTSTTHTITGLTDGVEYTVRVIATNGVGDGPPSAEATGTPRETTPPELATATVNGATLTLTYDEALDEASEPAAETFSVAVGGLERAIDGVSAAGSTVTLTLASAVTSEDTVAVTYATPTDTAAAHIRDLAGNAAPSFTSQAVVNNTPPPANTPAEGQPTISGTAQVGETLTANTDGIEDDDGLSNAVFTYQWMSNEGDISDATGASYKLAADDKGKAIKVKVSFTDDEGFKEELTSAATAAVAPKPNSPATGAPTISGTAQVGETLTAETQDIEDADGLNNVEFSHQWIANDGTTDAEIQGATDDSYTLVADDAGNFIKVQVSFTDDANNPEELTSAPTAAVAAKPNTPATGRPTISGTAQVGETLTV